RRAPRRRRGARSGRARTARRASCPVTAAQAPDSTSRVARDSPQVTARSVIVPAHDAGSHLPDCLAALRACGPAATEVIVVDDGSTDESAAIAARLGARVVRLTANAGAAAARNRGAAEARGDILLFVDADGAGGPDAGARALGE